MSSSQNLPSNKIRWYKKMMAKINHVEALEAAALRAEEKAAGPKKKKNKKQPISNDKQLTTAE